MQEQVFDSRKFINCVVEQAQFEELLSFNTAARILAVKDETGGKGKSQLLEKFKHRCRTVKPLTPVSLVALDEINDHSPLTLLKLIASHLSQLDFKSYKKFTRAADLGNVSFINSTVSTDSSTYEDVQQVKLGGVIADRIDHMVVSTGNLPALTQGQLNVVRDEIYDGFIKDMRDHCARRPAVIMLDGYEKSKPDIKSWVLDLLLERHFFNREASACRWALVIAGRDVPDFEERWPKEDCDALIMRINGLSTWTKDNVEQCMRVHGFREPDLKDVDSFFRMIEMGVPPQLVVQAIKSVLESGRRKVA